MALACCNHYRDQHFLEGVSAPNPWGYNDNMII